MLCWHGNETRNSVSKELIRAKHKLFFRFCFTEMALVPMHYAILLLQCLSIQMNASCILKQANNAKSVCPFHKENVLLMYIPNGIGTHSFLSNACFIMPECTSCIHLETRILKQNHGNILHWNGRAPITRRLHSDSNISARDTYLIKGLLVTLADDMFSF